jgi:hypothetical protein
MSTATQPTTRTLHGRVKGKVIEIVEEHNLDEGQMVELTVTTPTQQKEPWGEGIKRSAGSLADDPEWDEIMKEIYQARKQSRPIPDFSDITE